MSDFAAVIERVVATVTAISPRGTATAVVRETRAVVSAVARQGIAGPPGEPGRDASAIGRAVIIQAAPAAVWTLNHGLGRFPSVILVDTAGDCFDADLRYVDPDTIVITLIAPTAGTAYLN